MGLISKVVSAAKSAKAKSSSSSSSSGSSSSNSSSSSGYGSGSGYGNRETAYTWNDGSTTYSNATRYEDAAKEAGKTNVGLASAVSYSSNGTQTKNGSYTGGGGSDGKGGTNGQTSFTNNIYSQNKQTGKAYDNALTYEQQVANNYGLGTDKSVGKYGEGYGYTDTYYNPSNIPMLPGIAENLGVRNTNPYANIKDFAVNGNTAPVTQAVKRNAPLSGSNPYSSMIDTVQNRYDDFEDQIEAMNAASVKQGVNRLESQRSGINSTYEDSAKQAYINYLRQQYQMPETLAAQGINGGATETAALGLTNNYNNSLTSINNEKSKAITNLDNSIVDLKNTGDLQTAQQVLQNSQAALNAYQSLMQSAISQDNWQTEFNYNANRDSISDSRYNQEYADSRSDTAYQRQLEADTTNYNKAFSMAQLGYSNQQIADSLGMTLSDLQSMTNRINERNDLELSSDKLAYQQQLHDFKNSQNSTKVSSGGSSTSKSSSGSNKPTLTAAQTLSAIEDGIDSDTVRNAYQYYYGTAYKTEGMKKIDSVYQKAQSIGANQNSFTTALKQLLVTGQISEKDLSNWENSR